MRLAGMPFVVEGLRTYASHRAILRTYLILAGALAAALVATWPQGAVENILRGSGIADTFSVVAVTCLLFLLYLGGRYGAEDYSPDTLVNLREYVTLTPASILWLLAGKAAFAVLHTAFLLALGAPFLIAAYSVSGTPAGALGAALAVLAAATLVTRLFGLFLLAAFGARRLLRAAAFLASLAAYLLVTWLLLPAVNPVSVLIAVHEGAPVVFFVLLEAALCVLLMAGAVLVLAIARLSARRGSVDRV